MTAADYRRALARFRAGMAAIAAGLFAVEAATVWGGALLLWALIGLLLPIPGRAAALLGTVVTVAACVGTALAWIVRLRSLDRRSLPSRIEERLPASAGVLTTAATVTDRPEDVRRLGLSEELGAAVVEGAAGILIGTPAGVMLDRRGILRRGAALALAAAACAAVGAADPALLSLAARSLVLPVVAWPSPVRGMRLVPAEATVLAGGSLRVRAIADGADPAEADLVVRTSGVEPRRVAMRRLGRGIFEARLADLRSPAAYRAEAGDLVSDEGRLAIEPVPGVADIEVTVSPPPYTGLPQRRSPGGAVEALRGSVVTVAARGIKPLASGEVVFSDGTRRPLAVEGEGVRATFTPAASGWYRIAVTDRLGNPSPPGLDYPVTVIEDRPPVVLMVSPATDLELDGPAPVTVFGRSTDDFGVIALAVRYRLKDGEDRTVPIPVPRGGGREVDGEATVDLTALPLAPGDRVTLWLEARDNDAVSGPKVASSRQIVVLIKDPALQRKALEEAEKRVAEELVNALADGLELGAKLAAEQEGAPADAAPSPGSFAEAIRDRMTRAAADLTAIAEAASRSPRTPLNDLEELDALADQVRRIGERAARIPADAGRGGSGQERAEAAEQVEEITRSLEQAASLADQMPRRRNLRDAVDKGADMMAAQNRLMDALQKMEDRPGAEVDRAVRDALEKIGELLKELGDILSKAPDSLPEEFVNKDAMREFDPGSIAQDLQEIASLARQGKVAQARARAEELARKLAKLLASLKEGKEEMDRMGPEEMAGEMEDRKDELADMIAEQRSILDETQEIQNRVTRDLPAEERRRIGEALPELQRTAEEFREALRKLRRKLDQSPLLRASVGEVARNLEGRSGKLAEDLKGERPVNLPEVREEIERGLGDLETLASRPTSPEPLERERTAAEGELAEAARAGKEFRGVMARLPVDPKGLVSEKERQKMSGLSQRQGELQRKAAALSAKVDRLATLVPTIDRDAVEGMRQAASEMGKAAGALGEGDPLASTPPERAALSGLQRGKAGMESTAARMRRMARMSGVRAGDGGGRDLGGMFPSLRMGMKPSTGKDEGGRSGVSTREFAIPKAEEFVPEPGLRESLQRARGGNVPPAFREQVEEYYDRLSNK